MSGGKTSYASGQTNIGHTKLLITITKLHHHPLSILLIHSFAPPPSTPDPWHAISSTLSFTPLQLVLELCLNHGVSLPPCSCPPLGTGDAGAAPIYFLSTPLQPHPLGPRPLASPHPFQPLPYQAAVALSPGAAVAVAVALSPGAILKQQ